MPPALSMSTYFNIDGVFWGKIVPQSEKEVEETSEQDYVLDTTYAPTERLMRDEIQREVCGTTRMPH